MRACRGFPTPFTGRKAVLPPRIFEQFFHKILGPVAALSYLYSDPTHLSGGTFGDRVLCATYAPAIRQVGVAVLRGGAAVIGSG